MNLKGLLVPSYLEIDHICYHNLNLKALMTLLGFAHLHQSTLESRWFLQFSLFTEAQPYRDICLGSSNNLAKP